MSANALKVLIVDDEEPARSRMRDLLADIGRYWTVQEHHIHQLPLLQLTYQ